MPNRIIKESIWTSQNFNQLSDLAERHFYRILLLPDDFGCCELTPLVVKGKCYPLKQKITSGQINLWQDELEKCNIILRWSQGNRQYGIFVTFSKHQRIRSLHLRKTPEPPIEIITKLQAIITFDDDCQQLTSDDCLNPNPNPNPNPNLNPVIKEVISLPDWLDINLWKDFKDMRVKLKKPMTLRAEELLIKDLIKFKDQGYDPVEIINESIKNGWKGFFVHEKKNNDDNYNNLKKFARGE